MEQEGIGISHNRMRTEWHQSVVVTISLWPQYQQWKWKQNVVNAGTGTSSLISTIGALVGIPAVSDV